MENADKTTMVEVAKVSSVIDFRSKHSWAINNTNIDTSKNLKLIGYKKY